jgi:Smg protein
VRSHDGTLAHLDDISRSLKNLGFTESEISSAYGWFLEEVQSRSEKFVFSNDIGPMPPRVFSELEKQQIVTEAQGYLIQLYQMGLLSEDEFEQVVERALMMSPDKIDLEGMKMLASTVLFGNVPVNLDLNWFNVSGEETVH